MLRTRRTASCSDVGVTTGGWFDDDGSRLAGPHREFLRRLQEKAASWQVPDLLEDHTRAWLWPVDESRLLVEVDVAGLTCGPWTLRVLYTPGSEQHPLLDSEWGDEYLFDGPTDDADLRVSGVDATPEQAADWTAAWLHAELSRPVVRREWDRPAGGVARLLPPHTSGLAVVEWHFGDDGGLLDTTSRLVWSWLTRLPCSRETQERPSPKQQHLEPDR